MSSSFAASIAPPSQPQILFQRDNHKVEGERKIPPPFLSAARTSPDARGYVEPSGWSYILSGTTLSVWNIRRPELECSSLSLEPGQTFTPPLIAIIPEASASSAWVLALSESGHQFIWRLVGGQVVEAKKASRPYSLAAGSKISSVSFLSESRILAVGTSTGHIALFSSDVSSGRLQPFAPGSSSLDCNLAFSRSSSSENNQQQGSLLSSVGSMFGLSKPKAGSAKPSVSAAAAASSSSSSGSSSVGPVSHIIEGSSMAPGQHTLFSMTTKSLQKWSISSSGTCRSLWSIDLFSATQSEIQTHLLINVSFPGSKYWFLDTAVLQSGSSLVVLVAALADAQGLPAIRYGLASFEMGTGHLQSFSALPLQPDYEPRKEDALLWSATLSSSSSGTSLFVSWPNSVLSISDPFTIKANAIIIPIDTVLASGVLTADQGLRILTARHGLLKASNGTERLPVAQESDLARLFTDFCNERPQDHILSARVVSSPDLGRQCVEMSRSIIDSPPLRSPGAGASQIEDASLLLLPQLQEKAKTHADFLEFLNQYQIWTSKLSSLERKRVLEHGQKLMTAVALRKLQEERQPILVSSGLASDSLIFNALYWEPSKRDRSLQEPSNVSSFLRTMLLEGLDQLLPRMDVDQAACVWEGSTIVRTALDACDSFEISASEKYIPGGDDDSERPTWLDDEKITSDILRIHIDVLVKYLTEAAVMSDELHISLFECLTFFSSRRLKSMAIQAKSRPESVSDFEGARSVYIDQLCVLSQDEAAFDLALRYKDYARACSIADRRNWMQQLSECMANDKSRHLANAAFVHFLDKSPEKMANRVDSILRLFDVSEKAGLFDLLAEHLHKHEPFLEWIHLLQGSANCGSPQNVHKCARRLFDLSMHSSVAGLQERKTLLSLSKLCILSVPLDQKAPLMDLERRVKHELYLVGIQEWAQQNTILGEFAEPVMPIEKLLRAMTLPAVIQSNPLSLSHALEAFSKTRPSDRELLSEIWAGAWVSTMWQPIVDSQREGKLSDNDLVRFVQNETPFGIGARQWQGEGKLNLQVLLEGTQKFCATEEEKALARQLAPTIVQICSRMS